MCLQTLTNVLAGLTTAVHMPASMSKAHTNANVTMDSARLLHLLSQPARLEASNSAINDTALLQPKHWSYTMYFCPKNGNQWLSHSILTAEMLYKLSYTEMMERD